METIAATGVAAMCRWVLSVVLALSAAAKVGASTEVAQSAERFGVPRAAAGPVARVVVALEATLAVAVHVPQVSRFALATAAAMLAVFTFAVARALVRGNRFPCRCFGTGPAHPIGPGTLARNGALLAVTGTALALDSVAEVGAQWRWLRDSHTVALVALTLAVVAVLGVVATAALAGRLLQQNGRLLLSLEGRDPTADEPALAPMAHGLAVGTEVPQLPVSPAQGGLDQTVAQLCQSQVAALLVFLDPDCGPCATMADDLARWAHELAPVLSVQVLSRGTSAQNAGYVTKLGASRVWLQQDWEVGTAFGCVGTPSAVLVQQGAVTSDVASGAPAIEALVLGAAHAGVPGLPLVAVPGPQAAPHGALERPAPAAPSGRASRRG